MVAATPANCGWVGKRRVARAAAPRAGVAPLPRYARIRRHGHRRGGLRGRSWRLDVGYIDVNAPRTAAPAASQLLTQPQFAGPAARPVTGNRGANFYGPDLQPV
jgi:hypothetical protein